MHQTLDYSYRRHARNGMYTDMGFVPIGICMGSAIELRSNGNCDAQTHNDFFRPCMHKLHRAQIADKMVAIMIGSVH